MFVLFYPFSFVLYLFEILYSGSFSPKVRHTYAVALCACAATWSSVSRAARPTGFPFQLKLLVVCVTLCEIFYFCASFLFSTVENHMCMRHVVLCSEVLSIEPIAMYMQGKCSKPWAHSSPCRVLTRSEWTENPLPALHCVDCVWIKTVEQSVVLMGVYVVTFAKVLPNI